MGLCSPFHRLFLSPSSPTACLLIHARRHQRLPLAWDHEGGRAAARRDARLADGVTAVARGRER